MHRRGQSPAPLTDHNKRGTGAHLSTAGNIVHVLPLLERPPFSLPQRLNCYVHSAFGRCELHRPIDARLANVNTNPTGISSREVSLSTRASTHCPLPLAVNKSSFDRVRTRLSLLDLLCLHERTHRTHARGKHRLLCYPLFNAR